MGDSFVDSAAQRIDISDEYQAYSVTTATVIENVDETGQMRVQVRIPWLPGVDPWVRIAVLMAGPQRGTFFIPQVDDEVLIAFNQGDIRESYVIGSLWNDIDKPPASEPEDAVSKRLVCTPKGLQLRFDDEKSSITLIIKAPARKKQGAKSVAGVGAAQQKAGDQNQDVAPVITLDKKRITIRRATGTNQDKDQQIVTLDDKGITVEAVKGDIVFKAKKGKFRVEAQNVEIKSSGKAELKASGNCVVKGSQVKIN